MIAYEICRRWQYKQLGGQAEGGAAGSIHALKMSDKLQPESADKKSPDSVSFSVCRPDNDFCELSLFTQKVKAVSGARSSAKLAPLQTGSLKDCERRLQSA